MTEEQKKNQREYKRKYNEKHRDKVNEFQRLYYSKHKESVLNWNKSWRENNKDKFTKICNKRRKEVAEELKAKGMKFVYLPKTQRENKMIEYISRKLNLNENQSKRLLMQNDWNCVKIVQEYKN